VTVLSRRHALTGLLASVLGATVAGCPARSGTLTVRVSRDEIQRRLDRAFPVNQEFLLTRVVLEHPRVILTNGSDRIGVGLDVRVEIPILGPRSGSVTVSGGIDYRREQKAFFLLDPKLEQVNVEGLTAEQLGLVKGPLESVARGALTVLPIYELKQRNLGESVAERVLRKVWIKDGSVYAELGLPTSK
jgi:hypothetical protein